MIDRIVLCVVFGMALPAICQAEEAGGVAVEDFKLLASFVYRYDPSDSEGVALVAAIEPQLEVQITPALHGRLAIRARYDERDRLIPGRPDLDSYAPLSEPVLAGDHFMAEITDAYLEYRFANGQLRLGKQEIVWGELDGIKVLDVVNPQTFSEFILPDLDESRISTWAAYLDLNAGDWRVEGVLSPDRTTHFIPSRDAYYTLSAPRFNFGFAPEQTSAVPVRRENSDIEGTMGARVSRYVGGFDLQAIALRGPDFEPVGELRDGELVLNHYQRTVLGLAGVTSKGPFAFRVEGSYVPDRRLNTMENGQLGEAKFDQVRAAIGVDYNTPIGTFFNLQYLIDEVDADDAILVRPEKDELLTLFARQSFFYDALVVELRWYHDLNLHDDLYRASFRYQYTDSILLELAYDEFAGTPVGLFGQFDARDTVLFQVSVTL